MTAHRWRAASSCCAARARDRRELLARALSRPEVIDGVMQGEAIRLVVAEGARPPDGRRARRDAERLETTPVKPALRGCLRRPCSAASRSARSTVETRSAARQGEGPPPVEARGLTSRFGSFTAADRITFTIERGEIFGLLGPNGAGKSTTFKMMCGLLAPQRGHRARGRARPLPGARPRGARGSATWRRSSRSTAI